MLILRILALFLYAISLTSFFQEVFPMGARISVKALVLENGCLLLNVCEDETNDVYYTLPGGGQNLYEPLEEVLVREVLEETGYSVYPERLAGLYEEIFTDPLLQQNYPDYSHRIYLVFFCKLRHIPQITPVEKDYGRNRVHGFLLTNCLH